MSRWMRPPALGMNWISTRLAGVGDLGNGESLAVSQKSVFPAG